MANLTPRLPKRRTVFKVISIVVSVFLVAILLLFAYVYKESVGKFQLRRLSLPTRVFADFTPLKPGVSLSGDDLLEKLDRLGYRQSKSLQQPGDYMGAGKNGVDVYTRAVSTAKKWLVMVQQGIESTWREVPYSIVSRGVGKQGEQLNTDEAHLRAFWVQWDKLMRS